MRKNTMTPYPPPSDALLPRLLLRALAVFALLALIASCGPASGPTEAHTEHLAEYTSDADPTGGDGQIEDTTPSDEIPDAGRTPEPALHDSTPETQTEQPPEAPAPDRAAPEQVPDSFDFASSLQRFQTKYSLTLLQRPPFPVQTRHGEINGAIAATANIQSYARIFFPEWDLYPSALIQKIKLKSVAFCTKLSFAGQARSAIPDMENNILYLDVTRGTYSKTYLRRTIHHELFHFVDFYDDWKLYQDDEWAALNPKDFTYGSGGKDAQDQATASLLTEKYPGFFTLYSRTGVEEDKAEVFSILVVLAATAKAREAKDPIIAAKIARMKQLLTRFTPTVDQRFWDNAARLPRTP